MDFSKIRNYLFLGLLGIVTVLFLFLLKPFAYAIFWSAVIAALFSPVFQRLNRWTKSPNLSSTITLILVIFIIVLPLIIVGKLLITESVNLYTKINVGSINSAVTSFANQVRHSRLLNNLNFNESLITEKIASTSQWAINFLFSTIGNITQNSLTFLILFIVTLYSLFFFLRDGDKLLKKLMYLCPLGDKYEALLYKKFTKTAEAALRGTLVIALIQGLLGATMFAVVGVPGALIWGLVMTILCLIPGLGAFVIWFPTAIILWLLGDIWQSIAMVLFGTLVIGTIDNFLRPLLVGKGLHMHPLIILFSTIGGVSLFGISGFVIGPIIASLFLAFWEMYEEYYHTELKHN